MEVFLVFVFSSVPVCGYVWHYSDSLTGRAQWRRFQKADYLRTRSKHSHTHTHHAGSNPRETSFLKTWWINVTLTDHLVCVGVGLDFCLGGFVILNSKRWKTVTMLFFKGRNHNKQNELLLTIIIIMSGWAPQATKSKILQSATRR